jgi:hypothetical protein
MKKLIIALSILGLVAAPALFVAPAVASDVTFTGAERVELSYILTDDDSSTTGKGEFKGYGGIMEFPGGHFNSITAHIAVNDKVSGLLQIGTTQKTLANENDEEAFIKQYRITYNFGAGKFSFGRLESPFSNGINLPYTTYDGGPWVGFTPYELRQAGLQLDFGGFSVALRKNVAGPGPVNGGYNTGNADALGFTERIAYVPEIVAAYVWSNPMIFIKGTAGFQTYEVKNNATDKNAAITSAGATLSCRYTYGPGWVGAAGWYLLNPDNMGLSFGFPPAWGPSATLTGGAWVKNAKGDVNNATVIGGELGAGFTINQTVSLTAGGFYDTSSRDDIKTDDDAMGFYFNAPLNLGSGIQFVPEVGYLIWGKAGDPKVEQGNTGYISGTFGIFW